MPVGRERRDDRKPVLILERLRAVARVIAEERCAALRDAEPKTGEAPAYDGGIWVPGRQGALLVRIDTIDWIEAARDYVLLNTATKSHLLRARMNDLERALDPRLMVRIHRSHIVRIGAVVGIERPGKGRLRLLLADGANLQVGASYQPAVARALRLEN